MAYRILSLGLLALIIAGCASTPEFDESKVDKSLTPKTAVERGESAVGKTVLWGGTIIESRNLKDSTQLEVLAYPLNSWNRPRDSGAAMGRFLVRHAGYLETADYAAGRQITVIGPIESLKAGTIGESQYTYPVVQDEKLHLWEPESAGGSRGPNVNFGIGVIFSN